MTETKIQLVDWLDELCVRFIVNLPKEELESVERICFQVEEAQWFYEDFIRPLDPELPSLNLRNFCLRIFQHCPLLSDFSSHHHAAAFSEFLAYKTRVPVRGAILLNHDLDQVVLVKGWKKSASWSFPRGKINKDEADLDCAIREVNEETGFHVREAGLVGDDENVKYIDITMREQQLRLYIFSNVPMDTHFAPRTRKEISKIQWFKLSDLPTLKRQKQQQDQSDDLDIAASKFYMVAPFMVQLKKWISQQKRAGKSRKNQKKPAQSNSTNDLTVPNHLLSGPQPKQVTGFATGPLDPDPFAPVTVPPPLDKVTSSQNSPAPLATQLSRPSSIDERQGESSQDSKQILLSLFRKPSHTSPGEITSTIIPAITDPSPESSQSNPASDVVVEDPKKILLSLFTKPSHASQAEITSKIIPAVTDPPPESSQSNPASDDAVEDPKKILLSLFTKPAQTSQAEITSTATPPITDPPPQSSRSNAASPVAAYSWVSDSRISSITSAMAGVSASLEEEEDDDSLPRTTPGYTNYLLGYLDGIAKDERVSQMC